MPTWLPIPEASPHHRPPAAIPSAAPVGQARCRAADPCAAGANSPQTDRRDCASVRQGMADLQRQHDRIAVFVRVPSRRSGERSKMYPPRTFGRIDLFAGQLAEPVQTRIPARYAPDAANAPGPMSALTQCGRSRSPGTVSTRRRRSATPCARSRNSRTTASIDTGASGASKRRVKMSLCCTSDTQYSMASVGDNLRTGGSYHTTAHSRGPASDANLAALRRRMQGQSVAIRSNARRSIPRWSRRRRLR